MEFPIKKSIFAATNSTTPLNDAYHGGTSLFIKVYEIWNSKATLDLYYLKQSDISEGSPCRTVKITKYVEFRNKYVIEIL